MFDSSVNSEMVFSWAENENGEMVHVDDVLRGKACNCHCPACGEPLKARHGNIRSHGFAHLSHDRQANLEICYQVSLYKVAEQLIKNRKRIYLPSYYNIFPAKEVSFADVEINSEYKREDKQPDIIATTDDNQKYAIELYFDNKAAGHANERNYRKMNCIEINLANQTFDSIEGFITGKPDNNWKWVNNDFYFNSIEKQYKAYNHNVVLADMEMCKNCEITHRCNSKSCCAKYKGTNEIVEIQNNGKLYRICKIEQKEKQIAKCKQNRNTNNNIIYNSTINNNNINNIQKAINCCNCKHELHRFYKKGQIFCGKYYKRFNPNKADTCKEYTQKL